MIDDSDGEFEASRARRPGTARGGPDRQYPAEGSVYASGGATAGDVHDVIAHAVRLGYRVVEENLRHGRDAAERLRANDYGFGDAGADVEIVLHRFLKGARELGSSFFDLFGAVLEDPALREAVRARRTDVEARHSDQSSVGKASTPVQIIGHATASGEAHLGSLAGLSGPPEVMPLKPLSTAPETPPILGARLGAEPNTGAIAVIVPVPEDQPSGTYAGTIHDSASQRLLGSVSVAVPQS